MSSALTAAQAASDVGEAVGPALGDVVGAAAGALVAPAVGAAEAVGVGVGAVVALGVGWADPEAPGLGVADAVGVGAAAGRSGAVASTVRNRSWAGVPTCSTTSSFAAATLMTMWESPSVITSGSATPAPLTRFSMIRRACSSWSALGAWQSGVRAIRVIVVPPTRSRPSLGFSRSLKEPEPKPRTMPNKTMKSAASVNRYRDGRIGP